MPGTRIGPTGTDRPRRGSVAAMLGPADDGLVGLRGVPGIGAPERCGGTCATGVIRSWSPRTARSATRSRRPSRKRPSLAPLLEQVQDQTAVLAAEGNPFSLYQQFLRTRSPTPARGGEIAPDDILVPAGTTSFKPGPIVGELQHAGFPAAIEKGKVVLKKDTTIVKAGGVISREVAGLLTRLDIFPSRSASRSAPSSRGTRSTRPDVLAVDLDARRAEVVRAYRRALGLAVELGYRRRRPSRSSSRRPTARALALAVAAGYATPETIAPLFAPRDARGRGGSKAADSQGSPEGQPLPEGETWSTCTVHCCSTPPGSRSTRRA